MPRSYWVYILASGPNGVLYVGVTGDLVRRVFEHRSNVADGFTKRYHVHRLMHFEEYGDVRDALKREKRLKKWNRAWKVRLIETNNPTWADRYPTVATL